MSRQINLYDPALRRQRHWLTAASLAAAAATLLVVVMVLALLARAEQRSLEAQAAALSDQLSALQKQTVALGAELAGRKPDPKLEQELAALEQTLGTHREILTMLDRGLGMQGGGYAEYLRGLARQTPVDLWLTAFAVGAGGSGMEIRGRTLDPALLPEYIRRLNAERAFQGRSFAELQVSAVAPAAAAALARPYHEFALVPAKPESEAAVAQPRADSRRRR